MLQLVEQPLQARHPHIKHELTGDAMALQGQLGFGRHGQVTAAPTQYNHPAPLGIGIRQGPPGEATGLAMVHQVLDPLGTIG